MTDSETYTGSEIPDDLPPELNILMGAHLIYWKISEVMDAIGAQSQLSKNERSVLLLLELPRRMGALAELMQVLPSTVTSIADDLESKGFVTRERSPEDRRAWRLLLSDEGRTVRHEIVAQFARMFTEISGFSQSEIETMSSQMLKIARNIKASGLPKGAKPCQ